MFKPFTHTNFQINRIFASWCVDFFVIECIIFHCWKYLIIFLKYTNKNIFLQSFTPKNLNTSIYIFFFRFTEKYYWMFVEKKYWEKVLIKFLTFSRTLLYAYHKKQLSLMLKKSVKIRIVKKHNLLFVHVLVFKVF